MSNQNNLRNNKHLLQRAGFGIESNQIAQINSLKTKDIIKVIFKNANNYVPQFIDVADQSLKEIFIKQESLAGARDLVKNNLDSEGKRKIRTQHREDLKKLNIAWFNQMVNTTSVLHEKMALFWHGHFACRDVNVIYQQKLLHIIRSNALGNFGTLLKQVSQSASMISFLNNQQNKKQHPNENFAREVMELFTLGRGNYTEQDIKEAARAFTGWSYSLDGEFVFRKNNHDNEEKTFFGETKNFSGDDILNKLLENKQTAIYITTKIYKFFVNDTPNAKNITWLSERFYKNNYDIKLLLKDIFTSQWFYNSENINSNIKSPIELLVGIQNTIPMVIQKPETILLIQRSLGQILFYPPNVAGWPGYKNWIDTSSLMIRMQIPRLLKNFEPINITPKADDDVQMGMVDKQNKKTENVGSSRFAINAQIDWQEYIKQFSDIKRENLLEYIKQVLISKNDLDDSILNTEIDSSSREEFIKTATIAIMSSPEYQLC